MKDKTYINVRALQDNRKMLKGSRCSMQSPCSKKVVMSKVSPRKKYYEPTGHIVKSQRFGLAPCGISSFGDGLNDLILWKDSGVLAPFLQHITTSFIWVERVLELIMHGVLVCVLWVE